MIKRKLHAHSHWENVINSTIVQDLWVSPRAVNFRNKIESTFNYSDHFDQNIGHHPFTYMDLNQDLAQVLNLNHQLLRCKLCKYTIKIHIV